MKNTKKLSQLDSLTQFITASHNFVLIQFEKTTHTTLETLRKDLRKLGAVVKVIKNTILIKTINTLNAKTKNPGLRYLQKKIKDLKSHTAIISLGKDWSTGLNAFAKFIKNNQTLSFKLGYLDEQFFDAKSMDTISKLPSKTELLGKIIGSMKSPTSRLAYAVQFPSQKLVMVLNARVKKG